MKGLTSGPFKAKSCSHCRTDHPSRAPLCDHSNTFSSNKFLFKTSMDAKSSGWIRTVRTTEKSLTSWFIWNLSKTSQSQYRRPHPTHKFCNPKCFNFWYPIFWWEASAPKGGARFNHWVASRSFSKGGFLQYMWAWRRKTKNPEKPQKPANHHRDARISWD